MTILGCDVSKWQGRMDWKQAIQSGIKFAICRAGSIDNTTGNLYMDDQFIWNAETASSLIPTGFYWYFRPNHDPIRQAEYFASLLANKTYSIPPMLDVEEHSDMTGVGLRSAIRTCLDTLDALTGHVPGVYTSPGFWNIYVAKKLTYAWDRYPLWIASWDVSRPMIPNGWRDYRIWQYTVSNNGRFYGAESAEIDLDQWNISYPFPIQDKIVYLPFVVRGQGIRITIEPDEDQE